ncbi:hypothetical protein M422DRAFT_30226 [Sphaerobolus stellatus SS14]|uniref:Fungal calcium binding protein domain-containing protein n=1 Tax=Sphaerobolus stellatus (strain SS14) TaxID=990650 RepID=A0A0C9W025_SPHS4|nr:hypothetical protein M422DRAFT_30226 [Sphaerobolus stellatus SS14]
MQFSIVALLSLASVAFASPISLHLARSCSAGKCAVALGPAGVGCIAAAAQIGVDPIADAGCVAGAVDSAVNVPDACSGCGGGIVSDIESLF